VEAEIKDKAFEKEYADWEDVKIAIRYLLLHDGHRYRNNRLRAQAIFILLLVADNGERIGAIARSEKYRAVERALLYSVRARAVGGVGLIDPAVGLATFHAAGGQPNRGTPL
jgi:hypothetical protein